ncbi:Rieske 2Fe-2S domain-containing protein [Capilliphycus salinus ALCB114379]|uniref:Rieske 2Fe-2S domain-containing protein n=1 Tax=Capilliphycus salinus TaxID=2768948 RepID=UPI0039A4F5E3
MNSSHSRSPFPNSWFRIATCDELPAKGVLPLRYFGRDFVLFRAEDGTPHLLDAHCPHLGAHLGYGGTVEGDTIRCPFHGWQWNCQGHCVKVPYADKSPQTQIKSWPIRELNGLIFMYYHHQNQEPNWEIPQVPECYSKDWTRLQSVRRWKVKTDLIQYLENSVDVSHLYSLHRQTFDDAVSNGIEIDGPTLTHRITQKYNLSAMLVGKLVGEANGSVTTTYYGPGYDVSYYWTKGLIQFGLFTIFTGTPIDEDYLDIQIFSCVKKVLPPPLNSLLAAFVKQDVEMTFKQDIDILEHRISPTHPILFEEDGPIKPSVRWASQFYSSENSDQNFAVKN